MATKGRPPSAKTLVDRQLGRNIQHPVLPAGESFHIPNHSGDHSAGRVDSDPTQDLDLINKKYVDDNDFWQRAGTVLSPETDGDSVEIHSLNNSIGQVISSIADGGIVTHDLLHNIKGVAFGTIGSDGGFRQKWDFDSGMYSLQHATSNTITDIMKVETTNKGITFPNSNIGINGGNPDNLEGSGLIIADAEAAEIALHDTGEASPFRLIAQDSRLEFKFGTSDYLFMDTSGNFDFQAGNITTTGNVIVGSSTTGQLDLSTAQSGGATGLTNVLKLSNRTGAATELGTAIGSGFNKNNGNEFFNLWGGGAGSTIFGGGVANDAYRRFRIKANGEILWGTGSATATASLAFTSGKLVTNTVWDFTGTHNFMNRLIIDGDHNEALIVRKNGDGGDIFMVDTNTPLVTSNAPIEVEDKIKLTSTGGYAIKLTNKTGGNSVAGQLVQTDTTTNDAVNLSGVNSDDTIGIILDSGVSDGSKMWIVVSGITDVLIDAVGSARGDRIITAPVGGFATPWNVGGAVATHFQEIGHCIESRVGAGLARCVLHFN